MKHDNDTIVRDICIATGAVTAACIASLATTAKYLFHFCIDTQWKRSVFHQSLIAPERIEKLQQGEAQEAGEWFAQAKQPVTITSDDGLRLHGWLFDPDCTAPKPHLYAICMHGYTGVPEETAKWAHRYARMGFTVLVPSQRAQDLSEGRYVGMGWLDREDILRWIDFILAEDPQAEIVVHGISMGAATTMMTAGEDTPENVKVFIEDCGYTSVWDVFSSELQLRFGLPEFPILYTASGVAKLRAGYTFGEASALRQVENCEKPMLFIHGTADDFIPYEMMDELYNAKPGDNKAELTADGAGHGEAMYALGDTYWDTVFDFIEPYMN